MFEQKNMFADERLCLLQCVVLMGAAGYLYIYSKLLQLVSKFQKKNTKWIEQEKIASYFDSESHLEPLLQKRKSS